MPMNIIFVLCCMVLQEARAKYTNSSKTKQSTIWDLFNWTLTAERRYQDKVTLQALGTADDGLQTTFPGATCNDTREWTGVTGRPGFVMQCKCNLSSSTFVPEIMGCLSNFKLKQGCRFTTGSWRWSTGWRWDTADDALVLLDYEYDDGITIAFNVSTTEYNLCSVESLSYLAEDLQWLKSSDYFFNYSKPTMFLLNNMWHLSWNVLKLPESVKKRLKGKILKFHIECEKPGPPQNADEEFEISSCLLVKVTGDFNVSSKYWDVSQNTTESTDDHTTTATGNLDKLLLSILIPLGVGLFVIIVVALACYVRHAAYFAQIQDRRRNLMIIDDDDVVDSKLIKENVIRESNV